MKRVTGIGGIFFKSQNPQWLYEWYEKHLGIKREDPVPAEFHWRDAQNPKRKGKTVWALFPAHTKYFGEGPQAFMLNYIVDDLKAVLKVLRTEGVNVDAKMEEHEYGSFGWITDPEGNRIELWEPPVERVSGGRKKKPARKKSKLAGKKKKKR